MRQYDNTDNAFIYDSVRTVAGQHGAQGEAEALAVAMQWRARDRMMKHEEVWSFVDYHTGLKIAEHPEKYETRPLYTRPAPAVPDAVGAELLADGNAWYSDAQREEIERKRGDMERLPRQLKHCADKPMRNLETFPSICAEAHKALSALASNKPVGDEELREAAKLAAMYLRTGFIECPRCGSDIETKNTDAEYTLNQALAASGR